MSTLFYIIHVYIHIASLKNMRKSMVNDYLADWYAYRRTTVAISVSNKNQPKSTCLHSRIFVFLSDKCQA